MRGRGARGRTAGEVAAGQARHGRNELPEEPVPSPLVVLARQFRSPLIYLLVAAAAVTLALREYLDAAAIAAAVIINAVVGYGQERKAHRAVRALAQLVVPRARVVRDPAATELLVYNPDGRLALVVASGMIDGYRWDATDGKPMIVGGRSMLAQGKIIETTKQ